MIKSRFKPHIGKKSIILIAVCGVLIAADLLTKYFEELYGWNFTVIPGFIEVLSRLRNQGCAFSFLNDNPQIGQPVLISFTSLMLVVLIFVFTVTPERFTVIKIAVSIIIAGAIGNLVDRCMLHEVRDFIGLNMLFNSSRLVYCNLADFFIVIGAVLILADMLFFNENAVFPLTKKAKAAQAKRAEEEKANNGQSPASDSATESGADNFSYGDADAPQEGGNGNEDGNIDGN